MNDSAAPLSKRPSTGVALLAAALLLTSLDAQLGTPSRAPIATQPMQASTFVSPDVSATLIAGIPVTITQPGLYRVTGDLTGVSGVDGITVDADNVILDLGGYTLSGADGTGIGIRLANGREHLTVANGKLTNWEDGTSVNGSATLRDVSSRANTGRGFFLGRTLAEGLVAEGNGDIGIDLGAGCRAVRCVSRDNGNAAIRAGLSTLEGCRAEPVGANIGFSLGTGVVARNCEAIGLFDGTGFFCGEATLTDCVASQLAVGYQLFEGSVAKGCESRASAQVGFDVRSGRLEGCTETGFSDVGIRLGVGAVAVDCSVAQTGTCGIAVGDECVAERCYVRRPDASSDPVGGDGISAEYGAVVRDCRVDAAIENGIVVMDNFARIVGNRVHAAGAAGIVGHSDGVFSENLVSDCAGPGILVQGDKNRVEENSLRGNAIGLEVTGTDNLVIRNDAAGNGTAFAIQFGNTRGPLVTDQNFIQSTNPHANFDLTF